MRRACERSLPDRERLLARPAGYLLQVADDEVDCRRFSALADEGCAALETHDPDRAIQVLGQALALWRGEPAEDVPAGPVLGPVLATLSERLLAVIERHAAARMAVGQAGQVVPDLRDLLARHPCRERGWALLMNAQYRLGDVAGAFEGFTTARSALREYLGVEPGVELRRLQHAILNRTLETPPQDPDPPPSGARLVRPRTDPGGPHRTPPRQLPVMPAHLTGCDDQIRAITGALAGPAGGGRSRVVTVHGAPGSGTSALAITAAHQAAVHFPGGQLYVDLRDLPPGESADHVAGTILRGLTAKRSRHGVAAVRRHGSGPRSSTARFSWCWTMSPIRRWFAP